VTASHSSKRITINLQSGVVPISKAASALAALIKQAAQTGEPIVITQKGYPSGVIMSVAQYTELCRIAGRHANPDVPDAGTDELEA
jgi:prevent-host-death family protein